MTEASSPDIHGLGLTAAPLDAIRYDGQLDHPSEVAGVLHRMMPSGVRILDVGCGTASVTLIANRGRNNEVMAVEPDPDRAAVARSRGVDARTGLLDPAFVEEHGLFDVVMASDVLEHTADPSAFLALLKSAMKPEGQMLISVPNVAHWSVRWDLLRGRFDYEDVGIMDATHLRWFTYKTLKNLFAQCGLEIVESAQSAGSDLPVYVRNGFTRRVPGRIRTPIVRFLARKTPMLFGVQHVVRARIARH